MPFRITVDTVAGRIDTTLSGAIGKADLFSYYEALHRTEGFEPTLNEFIDLEGVTQVDLSSEDLKDFSSHTAPNTRQGRAVRVAIHAPGKVAFGMARMYEMLQGDSVNQVRVFDDRGEALAWIDADI